VFFPIRICRVVEISDPGQVAVFDSLSEPVSL
jgi:hypothetical protein